MENLTEIVLLIKQEGFIDLENKKNDATFRRYEAGGTPHWVLIDADGVIRKSIFGSMDGARQRLDYALEELFQAIL